MKASMIDVQIENSKDPFMVLQINVLNQVEETEYILNNLESLLTIEELNFLADDLIAADASKTVDYIIIKQSYIKQFQKISKKCGLQIEILNMAKTIFDSKNVEEFVSLFKNSDQSNQIEDIIRVIILSQFGVNDVLDKISEQGIESLNELNQYILEKESR